MYIQNADESMKGFSENAGINERILRCEKINCFQ